MKVLVIQNDNKSLDDISYVFQVCLPGVELINTGLGAKGIEMVKRTPLDMVILDVNLPDMSGFDVLKEIRCCSQIPVVILSFSRDEPDIVKALELGADEYIMKPFRQLEFMAHVRSLLKKSDHEIAANCN